MSHAFLLIPGLNASARLFDAQVPFLWTLGSVVIADHTRDDTIAAIAARILNDAPPRFTLLGHSMGGYVAFEIMRQAPERVDRLVLLDTSARQDTEAQTRSRLDCIALAESGRLADVNEGVFPFIVHESRIDDMALRLACDTMSEEVGVSAYIRQHTAIVTRPDSRATLASIRCPTLVMVGDNDQLTPPPLSEEIASGIDGATLVTIPDCGHLSTLERPSVVNSALACWLG